MGPIVRDFLVSLKTDLDILEANQDTEKNVRDQRVASIAFRVLGVCLYALAAGSASLGALTLFASPLASVPFFLSAGIAAILGHDLIKVGSNLSLELAILHNPVDENASYLERGVNFVGNLYQGREFVNAVQRETPHHLAGTWVLEPLYHIANRA